MENKKASITQIIIFSLIFLIMGGVAGYFIGLNQSPKNFNNPKENFPGNMQELNQTTISEITSFFENAQNIDEVNYYCRKNPRYCMEYCRDINPENKFCSSISMNTLNSTRSEFQRR